MHDTGCLGLVHWDDPEGWYGEGGGFRMGNTCIPVADSCWYMAKPIQYCKVKKKSIFQLNCPTVCSFVLTVLVNVHLSCIDQIRSVAQSCPTLCDPMNRSTPGLPVQHQLPEFTETHVHWVGDAIQPSHPLSSPSPPAPNPSQHPSLFQWVNSSHEVAQVLEFQL